MGSRQGRLLVAWISESTSADYRRVIGCRRARPCWCDAREAKEILEFHPQKLDIWRKRRSQRITDITMISPSRVPI